MVGLAAGGPAAAPVGAEAAAVAEARAAAAERRTELLFLQVEQQQQLLEEAAAKASEAEARLAAALKTQREAERRAAQLEAGRAQPADVSTLGSGGSGRDEQRRAAKRAAGSVAADAARRLATQQVAAAAAAEHVAAVDAALAQLSGPLSFGLPSKVAAAVAVAVGRAQAAASDLARLLQQQAQLEGRLAQARDQPSAQQVLAVPGCRRLWIGGVVLRPSEKEVLRAVEKFGPVDSVRVLLQRRCVFVDFAEPAAAAKALRALHGKALPQLSGTRQLTVQYQKDPGGPSGGSSTTGAAQQQQQQHQQQQQPSAHGCSTLSASAPEWQPPGMRQQQPPTVDEWEAAAEAAWAAAGGAWQECEEEGAAVDGGEASRQWWGEDGSEPDFLSQPELFLPSDLALEVDAMLAPTPRPQPAPLPLPLPVPLSVGAASSTTVDSSDSTGSEQREQEQQQGEGQGEEDGPCRSLVVSPLHPQQRWKPADFRRKIETAFSCCGRIEAVDVPKNRSFAFVHFASCEAAATAMAALQGAVVPELAGAPLQLKYSHRERPRAVRV